MNQPTNQPTNKLRNKITNSLKQGPSSEGNISSASEEHSRKERKLTVNYNGHRISLFVPILSQFNRLPAIPHHTISLHMS